jgi:hypothetical protein
VYIPTYHYLSHPIFFCIAQEAKNDFSNIYLNTKDPAFAQYNAEGIRIDEINRYFDEYREIQPPMRNNGQKLRFNGIVDLTNFIFSCWKFKNKLDEELKAIAPDAVITTSDLGGYVNRACNTWCEEKGVPFIVIQPAPAMDIPGNETTAARVIASLSYILFNQILRVPLFQKQSLFGNERKGNYLFLQGEYFKKNYRGKEIEDHIYIVGNPAVDPLLSNRFPRASLKNLGLERAEGFKALVTICTEGLDGLVDEICIKELNDFYKFAIEQNPEIYFVIKVHPRESTETYDQIFKENTGENYSVIKNVDLYKLFTITDVQISVASTTSLEAVVFGIPIVLANPNNAIQLMDFFQNEIELRAKTQEELNECIHRCLTDEYRMDFKAKRDKYIVSRYGFLDGKSAKRTIKNIQEIIKSRNQN